MIKSLFISLFFLFQQTSVSYKLSHDFAPFIKPRSSTVTLEEMMINSLSAPVGWIQGIQYYNPTCAGTSFTTTNIATGVCVKDGNSSSYMQYFVILPNSNPTSYEFYLDTFIDANCTTLSTHTDFGTLDPNFVCYLDNGNDNLSKTIYYYPGKTPPPYPYNGVLTSYVNTDENSNSTCTGTVLKTVILNPDTCYIYYMYNASDPNYPVRSYKTTCDSNTAVINILFSDLECTVPFIFNGTFSTIDNNICLPANIFREQHLPELYLLDSESQFNYENALASCYTGPTVFVRLTTFFDYIFNLFN